MSASQGSVPPACQRRFGRLPVEVAVELVRVRMSAGDIANLDIHDVIPLGELAEQPVALSVRGRVFALGDLMMADKALVVRLTSMVGDQTDGPWDGEE
ncbi:MAG: FliM/FliN family flagellar motor C-terminal domain-containing protein [Pseudomonadota bacterium]